MTIDRLIFYGSDKDREGRETIRMLNEAGVRYSTVPVAGRPSIRYGRRKLSMDPHTDYFEELRKLIEIAPKLNFIFEYNSPNL